MKEKSDEELLIMTKIKHLMLSSQSRELNKFIAQLIIAATKLIVFAEYCENNYHLHEKVFEMRTKMFAFFRESFCLLKTLRGTQQIDTLEITFTVLRDINKTLE